VKYLEASEFVGNPKDKNTSKKKMPNFAGSNHLAASGETARHSGIYRIEHAPDQIHEIEKEVFIRKGTKLPVCRQCGGPLKFRLIQRVDYIADDPDFE
jgi:hypothetical protein